VGKHYKIFIRLSELSPLEKRRLALGGNCGETGPLRFSQVPTGAHTTEIRRRNGTRSRPESDLPEKIRKTSDPKIASTGAFFLFFYFITIFFLLEHKSNRAHATQYCRIFRAYTTHRVNPLTFNFIQLIVWLTTILLFFFSIQVNLFLFRLIMWFRPCFMPLFNKRKTKIFFE